MSAPANDVSRPVPPSSSGSGQGGSAEDNPTPGAVEGNLTQSGDPWWHSKLVVALIAALGAAVAPVTTWLSSSQQRKLETERASNASQLQRQQQQHEAQLDFFQKVVAPTIAMTPEARLDSLRYFSSVLTDGTLRDWATNEYTTLKELVEARREAEERRVQEAAGAAAAADRAREGLARLDQEPAATRPAAAALQQEIDRNADEAKQRAAAAEQARRQAEQADRKLQQSMPRPLPARAAAPASAAAEADHLVAKLPPELLLRAAQAAAPSAPVAPASELGTVSFAARRESVSKSQSSGASYYRFSVELDAPEATLRRIARVDYYFDHPTFSQKELSSQDRSQRFSVGYLGWGCLSDVRATLRLTDGTAQERHFDMCALLR